MQNVTIIPKAVFWGTGHRRNFGLQLVPGQIAIIENYDFFDPREGQRTKRPIKSALISCLGAGMIFSTNLLESLRETDRGKVFLQNLIRDEKAGRIERDILRELVKDLKAYAKQKRYRKKTDPFTLLSSLLLQEGYCLRGMQSDPQACKYCSVSSFDTSFMDFYIDLSDYGDEPPKFHSPPQLWRFLEDIGGRFGIPYKAGAELRGQSLKIWLCHNDDLEGVLSETPQERVATKARDCLGLSSFSTDEFLICVTLEGPSKVKNLHRPLTFDAGPNLIFITNESREPYGHTVDLKTHLPGVKEYVTPPVLLQGTSSAPPAGLRALGVVRAGHGTDWELLVDKEHYGTEMEELLADIAHVLGAKS